MNLLPSDFLRVSPFFCLYRKCVSCKKKNGNAQRKRREGSGSCFAFALFSLFKKMIRHWLRAKMNRWWKSLGNTVEKNEQKDFPTVWPGISFTFSLQEVKRKVYIPAGQIEFTISFFNDFWSYFAEVFKSIRCVFFLQKIQDNFFRFHLTDKNV